MSSVHHNKVRDDVCNIRIVVCCGVVIRVVDIKHGMVLLVKAGEQHKVRLVLNLLDGGHQTSDVGRRMSNGDQQD